MNINAPSWSSSSRFLGGFASTKPPTKVHCQLFRSFANLSQFYVKFRILFWACCVDSTKSWIFPPRVRSRMALIHHLDRLYLDHSWPYTRVLEYSHFADTWSSLLATPWWLAKIKLIESILSPDWEHPSGRISIESKPNGWMGNSSIELCSWPIQIISAVTREC